MIFVSLSNSSGRQGAQFPGSNFDIEHACAAPYGTVIDGPQFLVVAECMSTVDRATLLHAAETLFADRESRYMPPPDVLSLVVVERRSGELVALSSIGCRRPLYYTLDGQRAMFSSHIAQMMNAGLRCDLNQQALAEVIVYRFVTPPSTVFSDVFQLVGGERVRLVAATLPQAQCSRWTLNPGSYTGSADEAVAACQQIMERSIGGAIESSSRPATLFSGGYDSSLVAAMSRRFHAKMPLFSSSFSFVDRQERESHYATTAAQALGLPLTVHEGSAEGYLRGLVYALKSAEEPLHHLQSVMLHLVFNDERTKRHDLLLSGEAADSVVGNVAAQRYFAHRRILTALNLPGLSNVARPAMAALGRIDKRFAYFSQDFDPSHRDEKNVLWSLGRYSTAEIAASHFGFSSDQLTRGRRAMLAAYADRPFLDQVAMLSLLCAAFKSMTIWSKLADAAGIAIHYPFADHELLRHLMALPWSVKCREPKFVVRQLLRKQGLGQSFLDRPKLSFGLPHRLWALPGALLQPLVDLAGAEFGRDAMTSLQVAEGPKAMALWNAVNIYVLKQLFVDRVDPSSLADEIIARHRSLAASSGGAARRPEPVALST